MTKNENSTPKRLICNIDEEIHKEIKIAAAKRNTSITNYVIQSVIWRIENEKV